MIYLLIFLNSRNFHCRRYLPSFLSLHKLIYLKSCKGKSRSIHGGRSCHRKTREKKPAKQSGGHTTILPQHNVHMVANNYLNSIGPYPYAWSCVFFMVINPCVVNPLHPISIVPKFCSLYPHKFPLWKQKVLQIHNVHLANQC